MKKRSRKFRESAKPSRRKSKNWPVPANSNTSRNYSLNFRRPSWTCFQFPDSGPRKSKRFTSNSTSARSNNYGKRANPAEWRNCPALAKRRRPRFVRRSSNARNIPVIFSLARLRLKRNRFEEIWRPIPMRSRSMSREVTGGEGKLCVMSILSSQRKSLGRLRNSWSNTRWWTLNEYRLARLPPDPKAKKAQGGRAIKRPTVKIPTVRDEADLYRALGLDFIPSELRENCSEFEAAEKHSLPRLLEQDNLCGTFHCHTVASDGHNSLGEMASAAQELGLEYLGIAEHSKSSIQAHGIDAAKLRSQIAAIRKMNRKFDGFRLFAGVECDILRDGKLDFDDEILSELDFAVASIHSVFNLSEAEMTKRIIRAMENPFITILGHPTGRLLLKRDPYLVDVRAVLEAAAATGTWMELNAAPKRLDLDWRWWPLAKRKGVKCVINPDAHRTERLQDLWFGVGIARKGWLTKADVMNCLPLGRIESALQGKRNKKA